MRLTLVNLYPTDTLAKYLLSSYVLKAYLLAHSPGAGPPAITVLDFPVDTSPGEVAGHIAATAPDAVGYSCYVWNVEEILEIIPRLRQTRRAVHILGGPEISRRRVAALPDPGIADFYILGEGERPLAQFLERLSRPADDLATLPAGVARWQDGTLRLTEADDGGVPLAEVPSVYLSGALEPRLYERQMAFIETQRGCRYKCKYCVYHKHLPRMAYFPEERVLDELRHLIVDKGVQAVRFLDSIFPSDLERAKTIVRWLRDLRADGGIRLPWIYWEFTYESVDDEFLGLVASLKTRPTIHNHREVAPLDRPQLYGELLAGYTAVNCVGVQSFHAPALRAVGRAPVHPERFDDFMAALRRHNVAMKADIILGLPFETMESYFQGLERFLPEFEGTDHIFNVHRMQMLPGSELEALGDRYGIRYSRRAPHLVLATDSLAAADLNRAAKLTALLFRVVNSPLRGRFFEWKRRTGAHVHDLAGRLLAAMAAEDALKDSRLVREEVIDDGYWNEGIFREIPFKWLAARMRPASEEVAAP